MRSRMYLQPWFRPLSLSFRLQLATRASAVIRVRIVMLGSRLHQVMTHFDWIADVEDQNRHSVADLNHHGPIFIRLCIYYLLSCTYYTVLKHDILDLSFEVLLQGF